MASLRNVPWLNDIFWPFCIKSGQKDEDKKQFYEHFLNNYFSILQTTKRLTDYLKD